MAHKFQTCILLMAALKNEGKEQTRRKCVQKMYLTGTCDQTMQREPPTPQAREHQQSSKDGREIPMDSPPEWNVSGQEHEEDDQRCTEETDTVARCMPSTPPRMARITTGQ